MTEQSPESWDRAASTFDEAPDHGLRDTQTRESWRQLLQRVLPPPEALVADLGCGTGTLSLLMAELGHSIDGVDFSADMLDLARSKAAEHAAIRFHHGNAAAPPLPASRYDVVLCRHVLWALPDPELALQVWRNLLTTDGRMVLIEGQWSTGVGLPAPDLRALLESIDCRDVRIELLTDMQLWGGPITDDRYVATASR